MDVTPTSGRIQPLGRARACSMPDCASGKAASKLEPYGCRRGIATEENRWPQVELAAEQPAFSLSGESMSLTIWCNTKLTEGATQRLIDGTRAHRVIFSANA